MRRAPKERAGAADGSFSLRDPEQAAAAVPNAANPSHHPLLLRDPLRRGWNRDAEAYTAISLLLVGLCARG